ncbi:acyltransferase [Pseudomonas sp. B11D7D]|nr:acyltransferase family protein [Pseudomonas sp. B11D7D]QNH04853.1 acyltransferase [Pseudomonas sp. B11D7D]
MSIAYRREIDGLRALAVLPVIFFHAGVQFFSGGYVGVDVFFVISGYLISAIILSDLDAGSFSLYRFYERRARRILPALFLVVALCALVSWHVLLSRDMKDFSQSVVATVLFSSNFLFWRESGYFDVAADLKPLLHTWSLAVEEQYYVFFPVLLLFLARFRWFFFAAFLVGVLCLSFALAQLWLFKDAAASFYLLPMRIWEFLVGALVALFVRKRFFSLGGGASQVASFAGLLLVLLPVFLFDKVTPFPGLYAIFPVLGAGLVIMYAKPGTLVCSVLSSRILVAIGLVSYSAYLFHQPIFAFARYLSPSALGLLEALALMIVVFFMAYLSWRYIEGPFRDPRYVPRSVFYVGLIVVSGCLVSFGVLGHLSQGFKARPGVERLSDLEGLIRVNHGLSASCDGAYTESLNCVSDASSEKVLLWGDSFAMHLAPALRASESALVFRQHTLSSCRPVLGVSIVNNLRSQQWAADCIAHNQRVLQWLKERPAVEYVVLSSPFTFSDSDLLLGERLAPYSFDEVRERLLKTISDIRGLGRKVVIVSPPPSTGEDLGRCFVNASRFERSLDICDFDSRGLSVSALEASKLLRALDGVNVIWLDEYICSSGRCLSHFGDVPVYRDKGHLSISASEYIGRKYDLMGRVLREAN